MLTLVGRPDMTVIQIIFKMISMAKSQNRGAAVPIDRASAPFRQQHLLDHRKILQLRRRILGVFYLVQGQHQPVLAVVQPIEIDQIELLGTVVQTYEVVIAEHHVIVELFAYHPDRQVGVLEVTAHLDIAQRLEYGQETELLLG